MGDQILIHTIQFPKDNVIKVPPQENHAKLHVYTRARPLRRRIIRNFRRCLCASFCTAVSVIILVFIIFYFVFKPEAPIYSLASLSINGFESLLSSPLTPLNPIMNMTIHTENPNKRITISYQKGGAISVSFDKVELCNGDWPEFHQKPGNVTEFETDLTGSDILLTSSTRNAILKAENNSMVPLMLYAKVPVKIKISSVTSWRITIKMSCDVIVDQLMIRATVISKNCRVKSHYLW